MDSQWSPYHCLDYITPCHFSLNSSTCIVSTTPELLWMNEKLLNRKSKKMHNGNHDFRLFTSLRSFGLKQGQQTSGLRELFCSWVFTRTLKSINKSRIQNGGAREFGIKEQGILWARNWFLWPEGSDSTFAHKSTPDPYRLSLFQQPNLCTESFCSCFC